MTVNVISSSVNLKFLCCVSTKGQRIVAQVNRGAIQPAQGFRSWSDEQDVEPAIPSVKQMYQQSCCAQKQHPVHEYIKDVIDGGQPFACGCRKGVENEASNRLKIIVK